MVKLVSLKLACVLQIFQPVDKEMSEAYGPARCQKSLTNTRGQHNEFYLFSHLLCKIVGGAFEKLKSHPQLQFRLRSINKHFLNARQHLVLGRKIKEML
jgi:hypothetical protein